MVTCLNIYHSADNTPIMATHFVTLGWDHPSRILPSILEKDRPDRVVLFCADKTDDPQDREVGSAIAEFIRLRLADLRVPAEVVRVHPFDASRIYEEFLRVERTVTNDVRLNITGGTKIMVVAAMMYAMRSDRVRSIQYAVAEEYLSPLKHQRLRPEQIDRMDPKIFISAGFRRNVEIPRITNPRLLADERDVETVIIRELNGRSFASVGELVLRVSRSASLSLNTVRDRLHRLREAGYIALTHEGRMARPSLSKAGKELAELMQATTVSKQPRTAT